MDLATKIVLLLTALVGLFTVARGSARPSSIQLSRDHPLAALVQVAGVLGTILVFPLFILAFSWIVSAVSHVNEKPDRVDGLARVEEDSLAKAWAVQSDPAYAMLIAAEETNSLSAQDAILVNTARVALSHQHPALAWLAARKINTLGRRDSVVVAAVRGFLGVSDYVSAARALPDINDLSLRDRTAELVANSAAKYGYPSPVGLTSR